MQMQQHIDSGCKKCGATLLVFNSLQSIAEQENAFIPPADVIRVVKSFAVAQQESRGFRLLFDSDLQPVTAGIRGSVSARQFLYETDEYYVDFRLEARREADRAFVVGQVLSRAGLGGAAKGIAVRVQAGRRPVAETTANRFGEFQLEFEVSDGLSIAIGRGPGSAHEVVLPLCGMDAKPLKPEDLE
jgi:hypothetical protein